MISDFHFVPSVNPTLQTALFPALPRSLSLISDLDVNNEGGRSSFTASGNDASDQFSSQGASSATSAGQSGVGQMGSSGNYASGHQGAAETRESPRAVRVCR